MPTIHIHSTGSRERTASVHKIVNAAGFDSRELGVVRMRKEVDPTERLVYNNRLLHLCEQVLCGGTLNLLMDAEVGGFQLGHMMIQLELQRDGSDEDSFPEGTDTAFNKSEIPYSLNEVELAERMVSCVRMTLERERQGENIGLGLGMVGQPNQRYPAYESHLDAGLRLGHANYLNDMAHVSVQFVDLRHTKCLDPHETYAWTVQAASWQRGMTNPDVEVLPVISCFPTGGGKGSGSRMHLQAQMQALHDLGYDEFVLWEAGLDPASMQQIMRDARMCFGMEAQEQEAPLFDAAADQEEQNARQDQEQAQLQQGFDETVSS